MSWFYAFALVILLISLLAGFWRILKGPADADRMLSAQLFGTTGVAILLILSVLLEQPALLDVALILAMLAVVATLGFVQRVRSKDE